MRRVISNIVTLGLVFVLSQALAFQPAEGVEIVLTDMLGEQLIGYGFIKDRELILELSDAHTEFLMLIVYPDGEFTTLMGVSSADEGLTITIDGSEENFEAYLASYDIDLQIETMFDYEPEAPSLMDDVDEDFYDLPNLPQEMDATPTPPYDSDQQEGPGGYTWP